MFLTKVLKSIFLSLCVGTACLCLPACGTVDPWFDDDCYDDGSNPNYSPIGTMAYFCEKDRVYWQLTRHPELADDYNIDKVDWFKAWDEVSRDIRIQYIDETIRLFKYKQGE